MNYLRKVHLYGDPCPSASGSEPATVAQLADFLKLPERRRCQACNKRARKAHDSGVSLLDGAQRHE